MRVARVCVAVLCSGVLYAQSGIEADRVPLRPVTVADTIQMTKLGDWRYYWGAPAAGRVAQFSRDSAKFAVVLRRGNLENNTNEFSLLLWRTADVFTSTSPENVLTMASSSNRDGIENVNWLDDNETLAFAGEHPGELHQVYSLNTKNRMLRRLTNHVTNVRSFSVTPDGRGVAYTAEEPTQTIWNDRARRNGIVVSTQLLADLVAGHSVHPETLEGQLFFRSDVGTRRMNLVGKVPRWYDTPFVSPDRKYIVIATYVAQTPREWSEYTDGVLQVRQRAGIQERYELVSTETGESRVLLDSPIGPYVSEVAWLPDSRSVVLSCVYLPLTATTSDERQRRRSKTFALEVSVPEGNITKITDQDVKINEWRSGSNQLVFEVRNPRQPLPGPKVFFQKIGAKWEGVSNPEAVLARPDIVLDEDMNTSPKIFAVGGSSDPRKLLLELNPQFKRGLDFGKVEEVTWKGTDGHEVKGGLYYPPNYIAGSRYPLVIQTHGWNPKKFWIDGELPTAFAAQPLAGKNIVVLQADEIWYGPDFDTPKEVDREVATLEGAVDYLDRRGLIDRNRVGLLGFSRTCLFVKYALSHSKYRFAAASVTDGVDGGYFTYIAFVTSHGTTLSDGVNGPPPFGEGLKSWFARSPAFSIDKVTTPIRITALNPLSVLGEWEWFAALRTLGMPVELVMLQDGQHALERPWERIVSQQGNVDWFDFWLNGHEDPDPAKAEQYARWRELRKLQAASTKANPSSN